MGHFFGIDCAWVIVKHYFNITSISLQTSYNTKSNVYVKCWNTCIKIQPKAKVLKKRGERI